VRVHLKEFSVAVEGLPVSAVVGHPPFDAEVETALAAASRHYVGRALTIDDLADFRTACYVERPDVEVITRNGAVHVDEVTLPVGGDRPPIDIVVLRPAEFDQDGRSRPLLFGIHGGGMIAGNKWDLTDRLAGWVDETGCVAIGLEYRLAPEFPHPIPVEDCFATLTAIVADAERFHVDPQKIVVYGQSAGGGLAAGVALLARDRGGPAISHQILECPMLDDRFITRSSRELDAEGAWDIQSNLLGWTCLLGDARGTDGVTPYAAPARATDLSRLPPTYLDVGQVESFRDETVDFAVRLSHAQVPVELHVWPGGCHAFDLLAPDAPVSRVAAAVRSDYVKRAMNSLRG
jgi:acetyl esterase/lipase